MEDDALSMDIGGLLVTASEFLAMCWPLPSVGPDDEEDEEDDEDAP